jgi:hypothetical protein
MRPFMDKCVRLQMLATNLSRLGVPLALHGPDVHFVSRLSL